MLNSISHLIRPNKSVPVDRKSETVGNFEFGNDRVFSLWRESEDKAALRLPLKMPRLLKFQEPIMITPTARIWPRAPVGIQKEEVFQLSDCHSFGEK